MEDEPLSILHIGAGRYGKKFMIEDSFIGWFANAQGVEEYIVLARAPNIKKKRIRRNQVELRLVPSLIGSEAEFIFTQFCLLKIVQAKKFDVLICQSACFGGLAALAAWRRYRIPALLEFHGSEYFSNHRSDWKSKIIQKFTKQALECGGLIRVLSARMKEDFSYTYGQGYQDRLVVLPQQFNENIFRQDQYVPRKSTGRPRFLIVGGVNDNKGQLRLLRIFNKYRLPIELWVVGDGPQLQVCKKFVASCGDNLSVKFFGHISREMLSEVMLNCDGLVSFSKMEAMPRAIVEAMAMGLPILCTNVGYSQELVEGAECGQVIQSFEPDVVASVLLSFVEDPGRMCEMGRKAHLFAHAKLSSKLLGTKYRSLIRAAARATCFQQI